MWNHDVEKRKRGSACSIRKADIIVIAVCLSAAVLLGVFFILRLEAGSMAVISCDGVETAVISLQEPCYYLVRETKTGVSVEACETYPALPVEGSFNLLLVTDGSIHVEAADCRDQICVRHRPAAAAGESIICLPHRLVVEITDVGSNPAMDGVVE